MSGLSVRGAYPSGHVMLRGRDGLGLDPLPLIPWNRTRVSARESTWHIRRSSDEADSVIYWHEKARHTWSSGRGGRRRWRSPDNLPDHEKGPPVGLGPNRRSVRLRTGAVGGQGSRRAETRPVLFKLEYTVDWEGDSHENTRAVREKAEWTSSREGGMDHYLFQLTYTSDAWEALISNPEDRAATVRPVIQRLGGDIAASWICLGKYDLVAILRLPDDETAAAASMAFKAGGALSSVHVTRLFPWDKGLEAMTRAREAGYRPPAKNSPL